MIEQHTAIFVTERTTLIAMEEHQFAWETFSWMLDREFLSFLAGHLAETPQPKIRMSCNNAQIPAHWLRGEHFLFTYHEWVSFCQRFLRTSRRVGGQTSFAEFRQYCVVESNEKLSRSIDDLTGLFREVDFDIFVVLSTTKPRWENEVEGKTSLKYMEEEWIRLIPDMDAVLKDLIRESQNEINTDTPE
tara:strand:+ start:109 stop:675 length:567 start_codon:yes stop_codon:yes gene_type:complete